MTKIIPLMGEDKSPIKEKLIDCCLKIPESIAASHSRRFEKGGEFKLLEEALEGCNKAVVYLEQARDIFIKEIEGRALCEDLIKRYILARRKIFNLYPVRNFALQSGKIDISNGVYKAWEKFKLNG